jgi:uncharacterized membrane protein
LVPPLATAGILAARADFVLSGRALLLALTNVAAIQVAFSVVFWIGGYRQLTIREYGVFAFLRRGVLGVAVVSNFDVQSENSSL